KKTPEELQKMRESRPPFDSNRPRPPLDSARPQGSLRPQNVPSQKEQSVDDLLKAWQDKLRKK
ncbi:MAG: hypothetical protein FWD58_10840, partial [Firmicutes bacterium]|nr:hypothetical protein [Bacillota bacterium]